MSVCFFDISACYEIIFQKWQKGMYFLGTRRLPGVMVIRGVRWLVKAVNLLFLSKAIRSSLFADLMHVKKKRNNLNFMTRALPHGGSPSNEYSFILFGQEGKNSRFITITKTNNFDDRNIYSTIYFNQYFFHEKWTRYGSSLSIARNSEEKYNHLNFFLFIFFWNWHKNLTKEHDMESQN